MKIVLFTENNRAGGMDTFYPTVMENWPDPNDEFIFVCNASHPGLENLYQTIPDRCEIIAHNIPLNWTLSARLFWFLPAFLRRASQPFLRVLLAPFQLWMITRLFLGIAADELLVVNGGYPGGETCRLANIAWHRLGRGKSVHNIRNFAIPPRWFFAWYECLMDGALRRATKGFIGVSHICADSLRIRRQFAQHKEIYGVHNGLPLGQIGQIPSTAKGRLRALCNIPHDAPIVLMLATYEPRKGHEYLFKAMRQVFEKRPDTHLVICGDGTAADIAHVDLIRLRILDGANVHLKGFQPGGPELIHDADIVAIASQEFESFGWTAIEGMVRGKPIVSTNVGGLAEVVGLDEEAGYCCSVDESDTFGAYILKLIMQPDHAAEMGAAGIKRFERMFTADRMAAAYYDLVNSPKNGS